MAREIEVIDPALLFPDFYKRDALRRIKRDPGDRDDTTRAELEAAHNAQLVESYKRIGMEFIQWQSRRDSSVRDSHRHLDGQVVRVGEKFENGLWFPGDPTYIEKLGEEIYGCRCRPVPWFLPTGFRAPAGWFFPRELLRVR